MCDKLQGLSGNSEYSGADGICVASNRFLRFANADTQAFSTVADANSWLQSNQLKIIYPLATPQTISLGKIDLPYVSDGDSVWVDAQVTPTIDVTYWSENGETVSALSSTLTQTAAGLELQLQGKVDSDDHLPGYGAKRREAGSGLAASKPAESIPAAMARRTTSGSGLRGRLGAFPRILTNGISGKKRRISVSVPAWNLFEATAREKPSDESFFNNSGIPGYGLESTSICAV